MSNKKSETVAMCIHIPLVDMENLRLVADAEERSMAWLIRKFIAAGAKNNLARIQKSGSDLERYCIGVE